VDYSTQTGVMVSLRMGQVIERKLEPAVGEPLKIELESFVNCIRTRGVPVVSGEDGLRALELAICINEEIARRSK
jgi:predicted dehydrogenase